LNPYFGKAWFKNLSSKTMAPLANTLVIVGKLGKPFKRVGKYTKLISLMLKLLNINMKKIQL
jgi:hypothetical protein